MATIQSQHAASESDGDSVDSAEAFIQRKKKNKNRQDELDHILDEALRVAAEEAAERDSESSLSSLQKVRKKRCAKSKTTLCRRNADGDIVEVTWNTSNWYTLYVEPETVAICRQQKDWSSKFRRRFRLPYDAYEILIEEAKESVLFSRWSNRKDACGVPGSPIELMLLGSLRYIGRGWTFDDIEEATAIHEETHRQFFHVFIAWGSTSLFNRFVSPPLTREDALNNMAEFSSAGFHGCVGSSDATHIAMEKCSSWLSQLHKGPKLAMPSRSYNITVNHRRRILSTTCGHPSRWNDKTLQMYDRFMRGIYDGEILNSEDDVFKLYEPGPNGAPSTATYKGVWLIVDNGYIHWPTCIPPFKQWETIKQRRFSEWLESMRKDVECTFGIMKGRFRLLKAGIRLHGVEACDKIWLTCCAFHNFLLDYDGLEEEWGSLSVSDQSPYLGALGQHEIADFASTSFAVQRLLNASEFPSFDPTGMGVGTDAADDDGESSEDITVSQHVGRTFPIGSNEIRPVRECDFEWFRERIVDHFDWLFKNGQVSWPKRSGMVEPTVE
mmetsp:Transcript_9996/g.20675  ORF Transcript_9996/g.20675 Transcript_9996/m.20675 type:complete len:554 (-) Transcript_9996:27-1688(-)